MPALPASRRHPRSPIELLQLQRLAGNRAVARLMAQPDVQRAPDGGEGTGATPAAQLKAILHASHTGRAANTAAKAEIDDVPDEAVSFLQRELSQHPDLPSQYKSVAGIGLREDILGRTRDANFAAALALLHEPSNPAADTEDWARLGIALIPPGTADDTVNKIMFENDLAQRQRLAKTYHAAFKGVVMGKGDSLDNHIEDDMSGWRAQKYRIMLRRELTPADNLHFETTAIAGTHDEPAMKIIQDEWDKGPQAFQQLDHDWENLLHREGWVEGTLYESMHKEFLWGETRRIFDRIYTAYEAWRKGEKTEAQTNEVGAWAAEATFAEGMKGDIGVSEDQAQLLRSAGKLREYWEKKAKTDPAAAAQWAAKREWLNKWIDKALSSSGMTGDTSAREAKLMLLRAPTAADKIWLAKNRRDEDTIVKETFSAWVARNDRTLAGDCKNPPNGDPRPPFDLHMAIQVGNHEKYKPFYALVDPNLTHEQRGAKVLHVYVADQVLATENGNLEAASKMATGMGDQLGGVIAAYAMLYLAQTPGTTPADKFVAHLNSRFELHPTLVDLTVLVKPDTTPGQVLTHAYVRRGASRTGMLNRAALALVDVYDFFSAEHTNAEEDAALRRLERWVQLSETSGPELKTVMAIENVRSPEELVARGYNRYKSRLDDVRNVKGAMVEALGTFVDFVGRSILVAVFPPGGLMSLASALGAYTVGIALREGLLGEEYQTFDPANVSKFAGEIATFGFDELKFAKGISEVFNPTVNRALDIVKPQSGLSKFLEESAQRLASKTFEQTVTNAIEGQGLPTPGEISARAVQAMAMGYFKVLTPKVVDKPTVFSSPAERFRKNVANIIINGPPPKSAIGFALTKDMTDLFRKGIGGASGPEIAVGMLKTASISVAGSLTVAASMGAVQGREARRAKELEIKHPDLVHGDIDPAAYRVYAREIRGLRGLPGTVVPSYREWAARHAGQKIYIEGNDLVVPDSIELGGRAKSEKLKTMDEVMNPDRR